MTAKRCAEYRLINDPKVASSYRSSFGHYDQDKLVMSEVFYATACSLFFGIFIIRYHLDGMRTDGMVYADERMMGAIRQDQSLQQVRNVAFLPGIVGYSLAMPDIHWGYGFPIGGVAAFDEEEGVVSPGGVGYDIN